MNEKTILAIDPGHAKCGLALVSRDGLEQIQLVWRKISDLDHVVESVREAKDIRPFELIVVGGGTNSGQVVKTIRETVIGVSILVIDERDTTLQARERYWVSTKRRGWRRLLPATLQVPPEPIDDFAALILAERVLGAS